jgi:hypothetical protein
MRTLSSDRVKIRVRSGQNEAEIEAEMGQIREAIALIPEIASKFPEGRTELRHFIAPNEPTSSPPPPEIRSASDIPSIGVEKGDSLSDIISKFFADRWGKSPRKLSEVRDALQSYGLNYPKQSVAVALLRLAKSSRIRRFKSEGGEYVYTASTSAMPSGVLVLPDTEESAPEIENSANL